MEIDYPDDRSVSINTPMGTRTVDIGDIESYADLYVQTEDYNLFTISDKCISLIRNNLAACFQVDNKTLSVIMTGYIRTLQRYLHSLLERGPSFGYMADVTEYKKILEQIDCGDSEFLRNIENEMRQCLRYLPKQLIASHAFKIVKEIAQFNKVFTCPIVRAFNFNQLGVLNKSIASNNTEKKPSVPSQVILPKASVQSGDSKEQFLCHCRIYLLLRCRNHCQMLLSKAVLNHLIIQKT